MIIKRGETKTLTVTQDRTGQVGVEGSPGAPSRFISKISDPLSYLILLIKVYILSLSLLIHLIIILNKCSQITLRYGIEEVADLKIDF